MVLDFEEQGAEAPLFLLARICGMLGPCLTQESRRDERSTVAIVGEMLRTQLLARGGGGEDGSLADAVPDYVRAIGLPGLFSAGAAGVDDLRMEAKDMMARVDCCPLTKAIACIIAPGIHSANSSILFV